MNNFSLPSQSKPMLSTLVALLLSGCSLAPTYHRPEAPIPAHWADGTVNTREISTATQLGWQAFVTDKTLGRLIEISLQNNRDLRQTLLNVDAVRAQYLVQRSERLPGIQADGRSQRQRISKDLRTPNQPGVQSDYQAGIGLTSFELDLFGRVRNLSEAALQEYLATEEAARSTQVSLVTEVIQIYLTRSGAQQRYLLAAKTLEVRETSLKLMEQRRQSGASTELDYQEALGLTQQVRVDLERIDREFRQANNALVLLAGSDIRLLLSSTPEPGTLLVQNIGPSLPSSLLLTRPDIRAAEHRLQGQNASIGAARAAFFPRISLTGQFGATSSDLSNLFNSGQQTWSFMPHITLPLFDGGSNRANLDLAVARKDIAVAAYEQRVQTAFREVSDSLVATDTLQREETAQQALSQSSAMTLKLSEARYRNGADDHLRYLDAQRNDFINQMALVEVNVQRQIALTGLFRSLGGEWSSNVSRQANTDSNSSGVIAR